jgi:predicted metallo-beta-lactamase superfamily hydrolase
LEGNVWKTIEVAFFCEMSVFCYSIHYPYPYNCMDKDIELNLQNLSIIQALHSNMLHLAQHKVRSQNFTYFLQVQDTAT